MKAYGFYCKIFTFYKYHIICPYNSLCVLIYIMYGRVLSVPTYVCVVFWVFNASNHTLLCHTCHFWKMSVNAFIWTREAMLYQNIYFLTLFNKIVHIKICGENVQFTLKLWQFYAQVVTIPLSECLFMSTLCCQQVSRMIKNLQYKFLNMGLTPTPFWPWCSK